MGTNSVARREMTLLQGRHVSLAFRVVAMAIAVAAVPELTRACSTCFGAAGSNLNKGAANGVLFMLGVIGFVQIGFVALFWSFWRRARELRRRRESFRVLEGGLR